LELSLSANNLIKTFLFRDVETLRQRDLVLLLYIE